MGMKIINKNTRWLSRCQNLPSRSGLDYGARLRRRLKIKVPLRSGYSPYNYDSAFKTIQDNIQINQITNINSRRL